MSVPLHRNRCRRSEDDGRGKVKSALNRGNRKGGPEAAWPSLLVGHPAAVERIFAGHHANFIENRFFWRQVRAIFGNGLLASEGAEWQRHRRIAAEGRRAARARGAMKHGSSGRPPRPTHQP